MSSITQLVTSLMSLHDPLPSAGLLSVANPLSQPTIFLREALPSDAPSLMAAAQSGNFRTLNFPSVQAGLEKKIRTSMDSFRGVVADPAEQEMRFSILASTDRGEWIPIGSSTFYPQHGSPERPHHAYQTVPSTQPDEEGRVQDDSSLILIQNHNGPAEVGALIVHHAVTSREKGETHADILVEGVQHTIDVRPRYGRAASWIRFFWAALPQNRERYRPRTCLTEILPPFLELPDGSRSNAFYEAFARGHFDNRPYDEMDQLTNDDRSLIAARLPRVVTLRNLPEDARRVIGVPRTDSLPALRLLEKLGFKPLHQVDPIDAGPHFMGNFSENPIFIGAKDFFFGGTAHREEDMGPWRYGFVGHAREEDGIRFRAALGPFFVLDDHLYTTQPISRFLKLGVGIERPVTAVSLS